MKTLLIADHDNQTIADATTKALTAAGVHELETKDGSKINWRRELALRLMNLQKPDGSWTNDNARWWEKETPLTTSYSLIALEMVWRGL